IAMLPSSSRTLPRYRHHSAIAALRQRETSSATKSTLPHMHSGHTHPAHDISDERPCRRHRHSVWAAHAGCYWHRQLTDIELRRARDSRPLSSQQVPEPIITDVVTGKRVSDAELIPLTYQQRATVHDAQLSASAQKAGAGAATAIAGGFSIFVIVASFVGGLLGWLLIMRKCVVTVCQMRCRCS